MKILDIISSAKKKKKIIVIKTFTATTSREIHKSLDIHTFFPAEKKEEKQLKNIQK